MIMIPLWTIYVFIGILATACGLCWAIGYQGGREDERKRLTA